VYLLSNQLASILVFAATSLVKQERVASIDLGRRIGLSLIHIGRSAVQEILDEQKCPLYEITQRSGYPIFVCRAELTNTFAI
jgi:hypothetical protein